MKEKKDQMTDIIKMKLPLTKGERQVYVEKIRDSILAGYTNPLDAFIILKGLEDTIEQIRKEIQFYVMKEASKFGEKSFEHMGVNIQLSDRRTFDFSTCGDPIWDDEKKKEAEASKNRKEREKFLASIPYEGVSTLNGDIIKPPSFTTSEVITIKFKN